jgi:tetratricopeptide (TPR) repeat protein
MPSKASIIYLRVRNTGTAKAPSLFFHVLVGDETIATNQSITPERSRHILRFAEQYNALFESRFGAQVTKENLRALGVEMFNAWLAPVWEKINAKVTSGAPRWLVVASDDAGVLNLPWELLCPPEGDFLGVDAKFSVRRLPYADRPLFPFVGDLPPRPLRVLFVACAPLNHQQLDCEREEEAILRAAAKAGPNVAFDSCDLGTFEELRDRINEFQPHVVHLSGHGGVENGLGVFVFEDERGQSDNRTSTEIGQVFAGSNVQCGFISGCQTGKAPDIAALGGICQGLVAEEVPLAIGWAASIADDVAIAFATTFYRTLAAGQPVDRALTQARQDIRKLCDERDDPSWTLPVLYSATTQMQICDPGKAPEPPSRQLKPQVALQGMYGGYAEHFVGRRRELQRLLPPLRDGSLQTVLLTGIGGAGKSTLVTRLARKLESDGFTPIAVSGSPENPLTVAQLLEACGDAFLSRANELTDENLKKKLTQAHATLKNGGIDEDARLRFIVNTLNAQRFVLVMDNFEVNLDDTTRRILNPGLAGFYKYLFSHLIGGSRALITCRYQPADVDPLPQTAHEEQLGEFPEASFLKYMLRDETVERRYYNGELSQELLRELHRVLGGTPRFLEQIREVLKTISADELKKALAAVKLPATDEDTVLRAARDRYCEEIFTARLFGYLDADSQHALKCAAVYNIPVNAEALATAAGFSVEQIQSLIPAWLNYALAVPESDQGELLSVYGLLRGWLLANERFDPAARHVAHQNAGDFLLELDRRDREGELNLNWVDCLLEARSQYLAADRFDIARQVSGRINSFLTTRGLYQDLERLNLELLSFEEHPSPMSHIGRSYLDRGNYAEARGWYQRSFDLAEGDLPSEASSALLGLVHMDEKVGDYEAPREKFQRSLENEQQIGDRAGEATTWHQLGTIDLKVGDYEAAREKFQRALEMRQQIGDRAGEAATWHQLASIDVEVGDYEAARGKFQRSLEIKQQIGNRAGEAATWHQLASIDVNVGDYEAAREKFQRSLEIKQQIGDRYGEAATFYQLGMMAAEKGKLREGINLVALCFIIDHSIGHGDVENDFQAVAGMAQQLGYNQEQLNELLQEVALAYGADRGAGLLKEAFED